METTSNFQRRFFITSEACCHGFCLDEIQVAGHQPRSVATPVRADSKNISRNIFGSWPDDSGAACAACADCEAHVSKSSPNKNTVANRIGRNQWDSLEATGTSSCWSAWSGLRSDPDNSVSSALSSSAVAMFCGPILARQGVGGRRDLPRGHAIEIHRHPMSSGGGPHRRRQEKSHRLDGFGWVLRTSMLNAWWPRWRNGPLWRWLSQVGTTSSKLEVVQGIRTPTHGIQKTRMKWMRFSMGTGTDLVMFTSGSWLYFTLIPT